MSPALQELKLCRRSPIPSTWLTCLQTLWHHQQILLYLPSLHSMACSPPPPKESWLCPRTLFLPLAALSRHSFLILLFSLKDFLGGRGIKDSSSLLLLLLDVCSFLLSFQVSASLPHHYYPLSSRSLPDSSQISLH